MTGSARSRTVPTPYGDGRLDTYAARAASTTLVLSHGAGNGVEARDLVALAAALPTHGVSVALFEQPWRVAGKRIASPPPTLDVGLEAAVRAVAAVGARTPLVLGGRSAGARSAARCARRLGAVGCVALAFPLHPPGRPDRTRVAELTGSGVPTIVVQGERDPMGRPEEFPEGTDLVVVPTGDHGLKIPAGAPLSQEEALDLVVEAVLEWLVREVTGNR
jgi:predicted alpha/beta-hydrolase family hydrolase